MHAYRVAVLLVLSPEDKQFIFIGNVSFRALVWTGYARKKPDNIYIYKYLGTYLCLEDLLVNFVMLLPAR